MALTRRTWFQVAGATLLAASMLAPGVAGAARGPKTELDPKARLHPLLQVGAQQEPNKKVRVVVQKAGRHVDGKKLAAEAGSSTAEEIDFITSVTMEIPQKAALALSRNPNVRFVSPDLPVHLQAINTTALKTTYEQAIGVPGVWNPTLGTGLTGQGVTVAVLDSGVNTNHAALSDVTTFLVNPRATGRNDQNGHGTHVTGIVTGNDPQGRYIGVAPDAKVISLQVADDTGMSYESDLLRAMQWVSNNRVAFNIKVVNLSVNGAVPNSYLTSPLSAGVEVLWQRGVFVVVAAGNRGAALDAVKYGPANDPFVMTVGALDHNETAGTLDDTLAAFSSRGITQDGYAKPDILAPGRKIVAPLAGPSATLAKNNPERVVDSTYLRLSGTSMAAPVVAGVAALVLERYPTLTPDQLKWAMVNTAKRYPTQGLLDKAGVVDPAAILARVAQGNVGSANQGILLNNQVQLSLGSVLGTSAYWDSAYWDSAYWDSAYWDSAYWDAATWEATYETFNGD